MSDPVVDLHPSPPPQPSPTDSPPHPTSSAPPQPDDPAPNAPHSPAFKQTKWKNHHNNTPPPPSNSIVLKNLDYNISQLTLQEVVRRITGGRMGFVNISLIEDKTTKSFRGMAFVNFHNTEDATAALEQFTKMVINGRKVIAEFRRMKPSDRDRKALQEKRAKKFENYNDRQTFEKDISVDTNPNGNPVDKRAAFFAKRDTVRKADEQKRTEERAEKDKEREASFRKLLLEYSEAPTDEHTNDLVFDASLTAYERRMVHVICSEIGLGHISRMNEEGSRVLYVTKDPKRTIEWEEETSKANAVPDTRKPPTDFKRKNKENNERKKVDATNGGPLTKEEKKGITWFKPRSAMADTSVDTAAPSSGIRAPSYKVYIPPHKPKGPDGTSGFSSRSKKGEKAADSKETDAQDSDTSSEPTMNATVEAESADEDKSATTITEKSNSGKAVHTTLNPSVPAFSPSGGSPY